MMGPKLATASQERDLKIIVARAIKTSGNCSMVVREAKIWEEWLGTKYIIAPLHKHVF